jgi:hypothetical protein
MKDLEQNISPELREAVQRFGFDKVAAKMYGVAEINEKTASEIIGTKLMTRLAEWKEVSTGLNALRSLEKTGYAWSESGHKRDADDYNADSKYHHDKARSVDDYAERSPLKHILLDHPLASPYHRLSSRMKDRDAKMHEKGENSYLPFGGILTPSRHEEKENRGGAHTKKDKE